MLKFYIVKEDGTHAIKKFVTIKEFWDWTGKNYVTKIETLDQDTTYSFTNADGVTVSD
jgi:hypothetical protein